MKLEVYQEGYNWLILFQFLAHGDYMSAKYLSFEFLKKSEVDDSDMGDSIKL